MVDNWGLAYPNILLYMSMNIRNIRTLGMSNYNMFDNLKETQNYSS